MFHILLASCITIPVLYQSLVNSFFLYCKKKKKKNISQLRESTSNRYGKEEPLFPSSPCISYTKKY